MSSLSARLVWFSPFAMLVVTLVLSNTLSMAQEKPDAASSAENPSEPPSEQSVRAKLWNECIDNPELHGAWLVKWTPYETGSGSAFGYRVTAIVDTEKADRQLELLRQRLGDSLLDPTPQIERVIRLPLSHLLREVRRHVRKQTANAGHLVAGVVYGPDPREGGGTDPDSILEVVPYGRTQTATESAVVVEAFRKLINASEDWRGFVRNTHLETVVVDRHLRRATCTKTLRQDWKMIRARLQGKLGLTGAWIELAECLDYAGSFTRYDLYLRVDSATSGIEVSRLEKLIDGAIDRSFAVVELSSLPVKDLIRRLNLGIETFRRLDGCHINGAQFLLNNFGGEWKYCLVFSGQVAEAHQRQLLSSVAEQLMKKRAAWRRHVARDDFAALFHGLTQTATSASTGRRIYARALREYRNRHFAEAEELFRSAATAAPDELAFRYWRIVALLQQGKDSEALDHMRSIMRRGEGPDARRAVARSLERVQGALRMRLLALENEAATVSRR